MKTLYLIILLLLFQLSFSILKAQENRFFMPGEIKKAYENKTRSYDGKPGPNYWQNTVDYDIDVNFIPSEKLVDGYEKVTYHNNSPDTIRELVVRLYNDVFKKGNIRLNEVSEDDLHDGVELSDLIINDTLYDLEKLPKNKKEWYKYVHQIA